MGHAMVVLSFIGVQTCKHSLEAWETCFEAYALESKHFFFSLSICEALRSFDVPAH